MLLLGRGAGLSGGVPHLLLVLGDGLGVPAVPLVELPGVASFPSSPSFGHGGGNPPAALLGSAAAVLVVLLPGLRRC
jgi:hypothetical protein